MVVTWVVVLVCFTVVVEALVSVIVVLEVTVEAATLVVLFFLHGARRQEQALEIDAAGYFDRAVVALSRRRTNLTPGPLVVVTVATIVVEYVVWRVVSTLRIVVEKTFVTVTVSVLTEVLVTRQPIAPSVGSKSLTRPNEKQSREISGKRAGTRVGCSLEGGADCRWYRRARVPEPLV